MCSKGSLGLKFVEEQVDEDWGRCAALESQFYGTLYGFDHGANAFAVYVGGVGIMNGIGYGHN